MKRGRLLLGVLGVLAIVGATGLTALGEEIGFSRMVVVGDSLSAGYQSGGLMEASQLAGYAFLIANQAGAPLQLPLIGEPGVPNVLELVSWGPPPIIAPMAGSSPGRLDPFLQATNLAVPGHNVLDGLETRPDLPIDSLTDLVLGLPGLFQGVSMSQVEWAEALEPSVIILWIGSNDTLGAATSGSPELMTDPEVFRAAYDELFDRLAATGAPIVVGNIPDTTVIAYLTSGQELSYALGVPVSMLELALGVSADDYVTLPGLDLVPAILGGIVPGPLPDTMVLDAEEAAQIEETTALFTEIIAAKAAEYGAALVDINGILKEFDREGVEICGQRLATHYLGGIFSLDGVHPTNTAYGIVANAFITSLDRTFGAGLEAVDLCPIVAADPLVNPGVSYPLSALGSKTRGLLNTKPD